MSLCSMVVLLCLLRGLFFFADQDKMLDEGHILEDIYAIKKIVGYKGEDHTPYLEQIAALYLFLGMEPYPWNVEMDDLERAQAEVELLKTVVGVK
ncbi:hypothetical protein KP509_02G040900 [Ceratopteris richardii]|nr:hypothetical protein KP509_02G040900 [Ceratopteris richardii]